MEECVERMAEALAVLGRGDAVNPLRWGMRLPGGSGILGMMPASMSTPEVFGLKVVSGFPGNHVTGHDSHQGVVMLFESRHGAPVAIVDAGEITAIRTAATSAVATRLLAREDAGELAILGSGVQARTHLEAMLCVRPIRRVRVWSPTPAHRQAFAAAATERHGLEVRPVGSAEEAVRGADLLCTTTSAREPIVEGAWLAPGCHVNAVGSSVASARELDTAAAVKSRWFVDRRESTLAEAGDFLFPKQEGALDDGHIVAEIGELLLGQAAGRRTADEITLFKSLGLAVEDLAAAHHVWREAREQGMGTEVAIGGTAGG
jgi:ornithine cyclodeaminase